MVLNMVENVLTFNPDVSTAVTAPGTTGNRPPPRNKAIILQAKKILTIRARKAYNN